MLKPTDINQIVRFERRTGTKDQDGNETPGPWELFCERGVKARIQFSKEKVEQGHLHDKYTGSLNTWRDPEVDQVTAAMRVVFIDGWLSGKVAAIKAAMPENAVEMSFVVQIGEEP